MREADRSPEAAQRWVLVLAAVGSFMVALDALVVITALDTIRLHLHASVAELEWTVNAYTLTFAVLMITAAALGDRFGRRRVFVTGIGVFSTASAACALAPSAGWLIAARAVQGAGAAMVMPLAMALLTAAFPAARRGWALGIFGGATGLAVGAGPVVGGAIAQGLAWQWIFWLNVPIGLVAIPLTRRRIKESYGPRSALDMRGVVLVTMAGFGLVWGLVRGNSAGWGSPEVAGALAAGAASAAAFVAWELRAREPMLPMRLFRARAFAAGNAANFLLQASLTGAAFFIAQFWQATTGLGPLDAGLRLLPLTVTLFLVAPRAGQLVDRFGERPLIVTGLLSQGTGMAWIAVIAGPHLAYTQLIAPLFLAGAGASMAMPAAQKAVVSAVGPAEIGKASGTFQATRQFGSAFGVAIGIAVFTSSGSYASPQAFSAGFVPALAVSAVLALAGGIAGLAVPGRRAAAGAVAPRSGPAVPAGAGSGLEPRSVRRSASPGGDPRNPRCGAPPRETDGLGTTETTARSA
jgi:EmrB/QacA subfamily drug resistance transporter